MTRFVDDANRKPEVLQSRVVRLFLASPGDLAYERQLARQVVERVRSERAFRNRLNIEIVAWDQPGAGVAMEAGLTPQESISRGLPKPEACDLVVVIFWSRIGTPLPPNYCKPDGQPYLSGTEWEFHNALNGFRKRGRPSVWLYRRTEIPSIDLDDPHRLEKQDQWEKLQGFFANLVNPDGSLACGINEYDIPDNFRRVFEQHLRDKLFALVELGVGGGSVQPTTPLWLGSPYPGLEAYEPEQAPIFFGRGVEVDQLVRLLSSRRLRFLVVVGDSGSGKSSLVAAGLLPQLRDGAIGGQKWIDLRINPGERGGNPFLALANTLKRHVTADGVTAAELAADLAADPSHWRECTEHLLREHPDAAELVLVVDQFEELFTLTAPAEREVFLQLLRVATEIPRVRVIATLRADFYRKVTENKLLADLIRQLGNTFPLAPPGPGALHEMITGPAQAAGLDLEEGLVARILDDVGVDPGGLPLVAFALYELYERGKADLRLTLAEYEAIDGVRGAIQRRAEKTFERAARGDPNSLSRLFGNLVEVNENEVATRRPAPLQTVRAQAGELVDAFIRARLLVTGTGADGEPSITVAHEALLSGWPRLGDWIKHHARLLRVRSDLERAAKEWDRSGRPAGALRRGSVLRRYRRAGAGPDMAQVLSTQAQAYLRACVLRQRLRYTGVSTVIGAILLGALFHVWTQGARLDWQHGAELLAYRFGLYHPPWIPQMLVIEPGQDAFPNRFRMGSPSNDLRATRWERPAHDVTLTGPFAVGAFEITFAQYDVYCEAFRGGCPHDNEWGRGQRPVVGVSWEDAQDYAGWLSKLTGERYRLPTEAEWEYVARAGTDTAFWWGDSLKPRSANCAGCVVNGDDGEARTMPVGTFQANPWGLYDTAGNAAEWVWDCWYDSYEEAPSDGSPRDVANCTRRVLRGGSYLSNRDAVRAAYRSSAEPNYREIEFGFRLARTL